MKPPSCHSDVIEDVTHINCYPQVSFQSSHPYVTQVSSKMPPKSLGDMTNFSQVTQLSVKSHLRCQLAVMQMSHKMSSKATVKMPNYQMSSIKATFRQVCQLPLVTCHTSIQISVITKALFKMSLESISCKSTVNIFQSVNSFKSYSINLKPRSQFSDTIKQSTHVISQHQSSSFNDKL